MENRLQKKKKKPDVIGRVVSEEISRFNESSFTFMCMYG